MQCLSNVFLRILGGVQYLGLYADFLSSFSAFSVIFSFFFFFLLLFGLFGSISSAKLVMLSTRRCKSEFSPQNDYT